MTDILVCMPLTHPLMMAGSKIGTCADCSCKVQFRPHAPKIRKLCVVCAVLAIEAAKQRGDDVEFGTTQAMINDLHAHLKREKH